LATQNKKMILKRAEKNAFVFQIGPILRQVKALGGHIGNSLKQLFQLQIECAAGMSPKTQK